MSPLSPSSLVLSTSARYPRVMSLLTWLWAKGADVRRPHWLLTALQQRHHVDVARRIRLRTGELCFVDPFNDVVGAAMAKFGCFEPETVSFFLKVLEPGMTVVDAGAHVGQYSLISSTVVGPHGHIHAFEPEPHNYQRLCRNVRANRRSNITCVNSALSDSTGRLEFNLAEAGKSACHSLTRTRHSGSQTITVEATTLDEYVAKHDVAKLDLLKGDVEGAELPLIMGAAKTLAKFRPLLVLECSVHSKGFGYEPRDLVQFLRTADYQVFLLENSGLLECSDDWPSTEFFNVAAIPAERVDQFRHRLELIASLAA